MLFTDFICVSWLRITRRRTIRKGRHWGKPVLIFGARCCSTPRRNRRRVERSTATDSKVHNLCACRCSCALNKTSLLTVIYKLSTVPSGTQNATVPCVFSLSYRNVRLCRGDLGFGISHMYSRNSFTVLILCHIILVSDLLKESTSEGLPRGCLHRWVAQDLERGRVECMLSKEWSSDVYRIWNVHDIFLCIYFMVLECLFKAHALANDVNTLKKKKCYILIVKVMCKEPLNNWLWR